MPPATMADRVLKCPQCNAPLAPGLFQRAAVCPFCGSTVLLDQQRAVPAQRFRAAYQAWSSPEKQGDADWITIGDSHWALGPLLACGEISDVYAAARARWPTERALIKLLRDARDAAGFDHEWEVLTALTGRESAGAARFVDRLPQPILRGQVTVGAAAGGRAMVLRWASGFAHTFEDVRREYPRGIEPRPSIWIWRRTLELLAFAHDAGFVHGAVLPPHLLVETGEHGVRLVGFRAADRSEQPWREGRDAWERFYPANRPGSRRLTFAADLAMSARCVAYLLGGDGGSAEVPPSVPSPLARELAEVSALRSADAGEAWRRRERLGELAHEVFGSPAFCPVAMPQEA